ncbi:putative UMP kinase transcription factor Trihelix family [Helianthus annuus]|nr:putative UMP kinase transcription factor Trihelix family [Helianthus annuus]
MASSPPLIEPITAIANGDTLITSAAVTSPATTAEDLAKFDPNNRPEKKQKLDSGAGTGDDHRREREEWSGSEVTILLDSFTEKYIALNRTNLRRKDWAVVANLVAEGCDKQNRKSIEQCKNKVDNLKKRYKLETQRMESDVGSVSSWIWFKKMDYLFGAATVSEAAVSEAAVATVSEAASDDDKSAGLSSANKLRRSTRLAPQNGLVVMNNKKSLPNVKWKRVVFKVSGTALAGNGQTIDPKVALRIADEVATASRCGVEVAIIIGGRNFFCGDSWVSATDLDRPTAYQIGMMATVMNSILLQSALEKLGIPTRVQSAFVMPEVAEPYNRLRAMRHLDKGRVVIFGGVGAGTGNPLFTTDTAAALRATEINADAVVKGTNVDGIFDKNNIKLDRLSFRDAVFRDGTPLDSMAIQFCEDNAIPVVLFNMLEPGNVSKALTGKQVGTLIDQ